MHRMKTLYRTVSMLYAFIVLAETDQADAECPRDDDGDPESGPAPLSRPSREGQP